ncbi:MAG: sigma-70 family RNA polymerase sigma factor [Actinomycetota bacterium]|nr:sigma-70 family RNA polymerase sigma factor [Actinomycetota bacterium]
MTDRAGGHRDAGDELSRAFVAEWPRILASLIRFTGSVELAEDAAQEAFARAVASRDRAVLINPGAWITTVAKRAAIDAVRRDAALRARLPLLVDEPSAPSLADQPADDDRLGLLFLACSPELSAENRLALALRFVCGVPTEAIADALLVEHAAMSARLTRAKRQIERDGIRFATPDPEERAARLDDVLATVYVLYTTGHAAPVDSPLSRGRTAATATAIELARALRRLMPEDREVAGLLALLLLTQARAPSRFSAGGLVTLEEADRRLWDERTIQEGLDLAVIALPGGGRFALQAGIAGLHAEAPSWMATDWATIGALYDRLQAVWPSPAVALARIVARSYGEPGPAAALVDLAALEPTLVGAVGRQAVAVRADLLRRVGRPAEARSLYEQASVGERHAPTRDFFGRRIAELDGG